MGGLRSLVADRGVTFSNATGETWGRDAMLTSLSLAVGCVDAVGYLGLGQAFVANMTGNTVLLGLAIGQADGRDVLQAGSALRGFVLGVAAGAAIVERGPERAAWTPAVTAALGLEFAMLAAFAAGWLLPRRGPLRSSGVPLDRPVRGRDGRPERRGEAFAGRRRVDHLYHRHPHEPHGAGGRAAALGDPGARRGPPRIHGALGAGCH